MKLKFSSELNPVNVTRINSSILDMYIEPALLRHMHDTSFNMSKVNFTWNAISFEKDNIDV